MITISLPKRAMAVGLAFAVAILLTGAVSVIPTVSADHNTDHTIEQLQEQITSLQDQLAALSGGDGGGGECYAFTRDLYNGVGSGADVTALQDYLTGTGHFTFSGGSTGYFGPITQTAAGAWQADNGVAPTAGYWGPISRAAYNNVCTPGDDVDGEDAPAADLEGGTGSITVDLKSLYGGETVGEGDVDAPVLAFEIEADDDSDVEITSIKVKLAQNTGDDSDKIEDYIKSVSVWFDGDNVGEADADEFSEASSDVYSKSISLDGAVVRAGDEDLFTIAISAVNNIDSADLDSDAWNIGVSSIRFRDGDGVVTTDSFTLDVEAGTGEIYKSFDFDTFASANDVELKVSLNDADDDINEAHVINVETGSNDTDDVPLLSFQLEAEGGSINITEIPVTVTVDGATTTESYLVIAAHLFLNDEEIGSEDVPDDGAVVFNDLDIDMNESDVFDFMVKLDIQDLTGALTLGDTFMVEITGTNVDAIDAEDASGQDLAATDLTGSALGEASAAYDVGFQIVLVSVSGLKTFESETSGTGDRGTFVIKYDVSAFDGDIWLDNTCVEDNDESEVSTVTSYSVSNDGSNATACVITSSGSTDGGDAFQIEMDTTDTITLTVQVTAEADSSAFISLEAIGWDYESGGDDELFDFNLPGDFKTDPAFLDMF